MGFDTRVALEEFIIRVRCKVPTVGVQLLEIWERVCPRHVLNLPSVEIALRPHEAQILYVWTVVQHGIDKAAIAAILVGGV